ncbi:MAG: DUF2273 domain-containing protein [Syntrophomonas sp.]
MWEKLFQDILDQHRGKFIGIIVGLLGAILILTFGFWRSLFVIFCIVVGYFIGKRIDDNKSFNSLIKKFMGDKD